MFKSASHDASPPDVGRRGAVDAELATFFEVSLDMLCIRDKDLRFVKVNQAWEAALGYSIGELEGSPMLDFIHPDDAGASHGHMQRLVVEEEVAGFINRYRRRDGTYRHLEWRARRVGDLVYGVARDVTERLAIEAEMAAAKDAAEAANRAKSDFLANMSHEIRTPLNGVIGVAAALAKTQLTPEQREMVGLIESSGVTLERLVSDVLDFSKIEAGRLEIEEGVFDLRAELGGVLEMFRLRAQEKGLSFPVDWSVDARGEFLGDSLRIRQVVANLLSNAIKFTALGEVRVAIGVEDAGTAGQPATLVLEIEDTGVGFDAVFAGDLFQRFNQADGTITRRFGGTGLGLSITRALVEMMGGGISARSEPGQGSLFRVVLPLTRCRPLADYDADRSAALAAPVADDEGVLARLAGLKVLLAEDHPINQRVVQLILGPFGVELTTVEDGAQALAAFAAATFDLVLMDMQMPVMDGLAATRAIRGEERQAPERRRTPIVMLSANAMAQHRLDAETAGADLHVAKPITATALVEAVVTALDAG
ncbi:MAG: ATP-binding protein [Phenylobacterium sp.]|uniref:ATP-binding protein n=1 Tax=Phenylobacterium sp. TaxID=1871053 RepID=UPI0027362F90|nr:ATP-binding protein [Phenylobacterium sp.]MDP3745519.1 ATP-binding protein [Phenylobacterium sp.]